MCGQLTCTVIATVWWTPHVWAINVHSKCYCMVEGGPHMWLMCVGISVNHMLIQVPSYW